MKLPRCPACNSKTIAYKDGLVKCGNQQCGGLFDPREIASGRVEGGTHGHRPDERLLREEAGDHERGYVIKSRRTLKGGL